MFKFSRSTEEISISSCALHDIAAKGIRHAFQRSQCQLSAGDDFNEIIVLHQLLKRGVVQLDVTDDATILDISESLENHDYRARELVRAVVFSEAFLNK